MVYAMTVALATLPGDRYLQICASTSNPKAGRYGSREINRELEKVVSSTLVIASFAGQKVAVGLYDHMQESVFS